ncbi:serine/threonine protein phosphatase [Methyloligella sp. GL2]|nr:serine/threonine protein phosphatase [Methyloligella sp. GL2]
MRLPLLDLLSKIDNDIKGNVQDPEMAHLVFLGDYVDRGTDSKAVLDLLTSDLPAPATFLAGNHEQTLLRFLLEPEIVDQWRYFGGLETLTSYGVDVKEVRIGRGFAAARDAFVERLPQSHLRFFQHLQPSAESGEYFFCHAGVRPGVPLDRQDPRDLMWIREEFLNFDGPFEKTIVHGHTPGEEVYIGRHRINVDTGAYATRKLSAICLSGPSRRAISSG